MAEKLEEGSKLAVDIRIDLNGVRGFKVVTADRSAIVDNRWWIQLLWKHLNAFEDEQSDRIIELLDLTHEASRKAEREGNGGQGL